MAAPAPQQRLRDEVPALLAALLATEPETLAVAPVPERTGDLRLVAAGRSFLIEVKSSSAPGVVAGGAATIAAAVRARGQGEIPVLAVPHMTPAGRAACARAGVSWLDASGNAELVAPGLRILVQGRRPRWRTRGRPASVFAPKSARVARWLLLHPERALTQREIARATEMSEGFVSRIAARLVQEGYLQRDASGALRVRDAALLLDAWSEAYRFDKHTRFAGHVPARSGDALTRFTSDVLRELAVEHAATGLSAAWQMTRFAAFRTTTFYLAAAPSAALLERLRFREEERGANLWLVVPNDLGVLHGSMDRDGVRCVHPVQALLDLRAHAERSSEAAAHLKSLWLEGKLHDR